MAKRKRTEERRRDEPVEQAILPQKRHYRQRAHANPFSDHSLQYPASPDAVDWPLHFPGVVGPPKAPEFADIGCGFGGLMIALAPLLPDTLILGVYFRQSL